MATILIADDEARMRKILLLALSEEDHEVLEAKDAAEAISFLDRTYPSLIISDLRMPEGGGIAVLDAVKARNLNIPVVILTAYGTIENAVEAMHHGAYDYLLKPCDLDELVLKVNKALKAQHLQQENIYLREELDYRFSKGDIVAHSPKMQSIMEMLPKLTKSSHPVLLVGESGTGKELFARKIHQMQFGHERPFVVVKCSGVPADILDLELFGQVRGPGTATSSHKTGKVELATGGTIFLDEISELSPRLQNKLLRLLDENVIEPVGALQPKRVEVRLLAATSRNLVQMVESKIFRQDLYYRLNISPIHLPPLRERQDDIAALIKQFFQTNKLNNKINQFSEDQLVTLKSYPWPGNVRELIQMLERAMVLETTDLKKLLPQPPKKEAPLLFNESYKDLLNIDYKDAKKNILDQFDYLYFNHLLQKTHGNISRASDLSGMHRKNLHMKLAELGIEPKNFVLDKTS